jgi:hypothetical protein
MGVYMSVVTGRNLVAELARLGRDFDRLSRFSALYVEHEVFVSARPLSQAEWDRLLAPFGVPGLAGPTPHHPDHVGRVGVVSAEWQVWEHSPCGRNMAHFWGDEPDYELYRKHAQAGMDILQQMLADHGVVLGIGRALPESRNHHGWFELVLDSAYERDAVKQVGMFVTASRQIGFLAGELVKVRLDERVCGASAAAIRAWTKSDLMTPFWDEANRELRVGEQVVKRFAKPAQNQTLILSAFEEQCWNRQIDDPLPGGRLTPPQKRLNDTVADLNEGHETPGLLRFRTNGKGNGVIWAWGEGWQGTVRGGAASRQS